MCAGSLLAPPLLSKKKKKGREKSKKRKELIHKKQETWKEKKYKMMSESVLYSASAPGKLILFGEHAVVYGFEALAASLSDLRVCVDVLICDSGHLTLQMPDFSKSVELGSNEKGCSIALEGNCPMVTHHWPLAELGSGSLSIAIRAQTELKDYCGHSYPSPCAPSPEIVCALAEETGSLDSDAHRRAAAPVLFLCATMFRSELRDSRLTGISVKIRPPTLPVGAGLGSSAAVSTALSAALLQAYEGFHGRGEVWCAQSSPAPLERKVQEAINDWAFSAETLFHGSSSGLDNTVST